MSKKSFILFQEYRKNLSFLSQSQKGDLLDAIFAFNDDEEFELEPIVNMAFSFIKSDLIRNKEAWLDKKEERSRSGKLGNLAKWHKDLYSQVLSGDITILEAYKIVEDRKVSLSDNSESLKSQGIANIAVNVNDNVNDNDIKNINKKFDEFWTSYKSIHTSKGNKKKSKELLLKALKKESFENITQGLQKYMDHCHKNNIYTKSVETWLRNEQWANEYENNSSKSNINKSLVKSLSILTKDTLIKNVSVSASNNAVLYFDKKSDYDKLISLDVEIRSKIKDQINKELGTNNFEFKY